MSYDPAAYERRLDWLYALQRFGVRPGLERVRAMLADLGAPQARFRVVLVGGTNGKGSTAATLASILTESGARTGLFTSPHLVDFGERFVVDGTPLPTAAVAAALDEVTEVAKRADATFFEVVTALGVLSFARAGVDVAVMEVGLGGRLDATNALEPVLSIVTNVALDHEAVLGSTTVEIAREKAGILRSGRPALSGADGDALVVLREHAARVDADLWALEHEVTIDIRSLGWDGVEVALRGPAGDLTVRSPLLGRHQGRNVALAAAAARRLGIERDTILAGARRTRWPGRLERFDVRGRTVVLDGAHNPDAAAALRTALEDLGVRGATLAFGASSDKDVRSLVRELGPEFARVVCTCARLSPRAAEPEALAASWRGQHGASLVEVAASPAEALERALGVTPEGGVVVVAGSLFLVGETRAILTASELPERARLQ